MDILCTGLLIFSTEMTQDGLLGLILSNFLFGFAHMYQGLSGMLTTGLTGFIFAWLYFRTNKNLWACNTGSRNLRYNQFPDDLLWRLSGNLKSST
ncbi:MAG: CPBP family intramembrane metalloprotease [Ignavibacteriales bacterium]|nr:CPBP family intramembrane metalloprotease [Ignavibacteriales bacterium]